jgi:hypothetical protein
MNFEVHEGINTPTDLSAEKGLLFTYIRQDDIRILHPIDPAFSDLTATLDAVKSYSSTDTHQDICTNDLKKKKLLVNALEKT